jgi:hypothetical protein
MPADRGFLERHTQLLCASYRRWTNRPLVETTAPQVDQVQALWEAPFAVVAHDTAADPVFNYANACALHWFAMDWPAFTQLPSRLSAEPLAREERARLLARVAEHGYVDDYAGVRIAANGMRFMIRNAIVWNLVDEQGCYRGQAARFDAPLPSDILEQTSGDNLK